MYHLFSIRIIYVNIIQIRLKTWRDLRAFLRVKFGFKDLLCVKELRFRNSGYCHSELIKQMFEKNWTILNMHKSYAIGAKLLAFSPAGMWTDCSNRATNSKLDADGRVLIAINIYWIDYIFLYVVIPRISMLSPCGSMEVQVINFTSSTMRVASCMEAFMPAYIIYYEYPADNPEGPWHQLQKRSTYINIQIYIKVWYWCNLSDCIFIL